MINIKLVWLKSEVKDLCKYIKFDSQLLIYKITLDYLFTPWLTAYCLTPTLIDWLIVWLPHWLTDWLTDSLADWLSGSHTYWLQNEWLSVSHTDWLQTDWLPPWLTAYWLLWLVVWFTHLLTEDWLTHTLTDCILTDSHTDWMHTNFHTDWLTAYCQWTERTGKDMASGMYRANILYDRWETEIYMITAMGVRNTG